jgi:hypothetical protein
MEKSTLAVKSEHSEPKTAPTDSTTSFTLGGTELTTNKATSTTPTLSIAEITTTTTTTTVKFL